MSLGIVNFYFAQLSPVNLVWPELVPGIKVRPNYVCLLLSDCLYLAAHVCLRGCGELLNCTGECVCAQVPFYPVHVCLW